MRTASRLIQSCILLSISGCTTIPATAPKQNRLDDDLWPCRMGDKWGYIDHRGEFEIKPRFSHAHIFFNGLAPVQNEHGKFGYINTSGEYKIPPTFDVAVPFSSHGEAIINKNGKWGTISITGEFLIPPEFDKIGTSFTGVRAVQKEANIGVMNSKGKVIIPIRYKSIGLINETSMAAVKTHEDKVCVISNGNEIIPCEYDAYSSVVFPPVFVLSKKESNYIAVVKSGHASISRIPDGINIDEIYSSEEPTFIKLGE